MDKIEDPLKSLLIRDLKMELNVSSLNVVHISVLIFFFFLQMERAQTAEAPRLLEL